MTQTSPAITLEKLRRAIRLIDEPLIELTPQSLTYLRSYPALLAASRTLAGSHNSGDLLLQLSAMCYGWMPRVVRVNARHVDKASAALACALESDVLIDTAQMQDLANSLHSVVGTSKLLHFLRPQLYPIWDSKVARVWATSDATTNMSKVENYRSYIEDIRTLIASADFAAFHDDFNQAYGRRLDRLKIAPYSLSPVRAVEAAAFELSGGDYDDD
ncbi:hypothetical protein [Pseudomonas chlororaphis]|uniref:hypothetical protein n=1 Tax=Pseudomonas chlororaphis TaxID=587753 RepID=UPI0006A6324F|nr:hypothetical protein [Pseudomonas chlororaphis]AZD03497.1 hypothetical protein C4K27_4312 [Pseudomonas chlororaphis subsp. chlororaphis]MBM0284954.1 hypothetical protein [Pseudomonas chlororaphis]MDO1508572.1 hypothetical protein [Pseudomonas chlororaphis]ORM46129.1 hypothetical protein B6D51_21805 [Pseudomonas chlororaphis subsp. chlororaphis]TWR87994.1 hypothetical protein FJD36_30450 [Pseudomonas chlororaphis subsp. chlororaphis]